MSYNQEITPWQTQGEDQPFPTSFKDLSKIHRHSMTLHPNPSLHTILSPRGKLNSPQTDHQSESQSPKNPVNSLRFKRLSLAEVVNKRISGEDVLVIPPIHYNSVEFNTIPRLCGEHELQVRALTKRKVLELEQIVSERKEKEQRQKQQLAPLQIIPEIKTTLKLDRRYKSKSLSTLHNHIKYYKEKHRQKQNQNNKVENVKFDTLEEIIKRLPKIDKREDRREGRNSSSTIKSQTFQTIKFMEPTDRAIKVEKRSITKGKQEHILDRLFERMVERKKE